MPSIVQFGFLLLESREEGNVKEHSDSNGLLGIEELGIQLLKTLFDVHDMARNEVCTGFIITWFLLMILLLNQR